MNLSDANIRPEFRDISSSDNIGLLDALNVLYDSKWLIAGCVAIAAAAAGAYAFLVPPTYEATALIQIEEANASSSAGVGALRETAASFENRSPLSAEISILRSNLILEHVIEDLRLDVAAHPKRLPVIGYWLSSRASQPSEPGVFGFEGYVTGNESVDVGTFVVPREREGERFTITLTHSGYALRGADGALVFNGNIGKAGAFKLGGKPAQILVTSAVGRPGADFIVQRYPRANALGKLQRALTVEEQGRQSGVLLVKLTGHDAERVAQTLNGIGDYYVKEHVQRRVAQVDEALKFVSGNLPNIREQLLRTEQQLSRARSRRGTFDVSTEGRLTLEQHRSLQTTLQDLQRKRADLAGTYLSQHPVMQALDAQIRAVNSQMASVGGHIHTMPEMEQELVGLNRELKVNSDLYVSLLGSAQQLGLARQTSGGNIRVVDSARAPDEPVGPLPTTLLGFGASAGLVLGVCFAFVRASVRRGVSDPAQIENEAALSIATTVPLSLKQRTLSRRLGRASKDSQVLATRFPMDPAVDSLRNMLTLLPYSANEFESNIVVITGPTRSVGKSFISLNLAAVVGATGARVLLVDGDLHKGTLARSVAVRNDKGLSDVLAGRSRFEQVVQRDVMPNVDFLPAGQRTGSQANVLWARSIREVLKDNLKQYATVIIDSPPVLAAADSVVLSQQASAVFLVARAEVTSMREIQVSTKFLLQRGVQVKGVIFSGVDISKRQNDMYGYSGYGYLSAR
jgi:tyrosine-protein kinase Etk/Wzc